MTKGEWMTPEEYIAMVEEENKKLKLENAKLKDRIITDENFEEKLDKENKKLKERIKELEQCNLNLQTWLDNKEKLNKGYRKQIDKYKRQYQHSLGWDDELIYEEWLYD